MERSRKIGFLLKSSEFFPNSTSICCSRNFRTPTCSGWVITLWSRIHLLRSPAMFLPPVQIPSKINSAWLILVWGEILPQTVLIKWVDENKKKKHLSQTSSNMKCWIMLAPNCSVFHAFKSRLDPTSRFGIHCGELEPCSRRKFQNSKRLPGELEVLRGRSCFQVQIDSLGEGFYCPQNNHETPTK